MEFVLFASTDLQSADVHVTKEAVCVGRQSLRINVDLLSSIGRNVRTLGTTVNIAFLQLDEERSFKGFTMSCALVRSAKVRARLSL